MATFQLFLAQFKNENKGVKIFYHNTLNEGDLLRLAMKINNQSLKTLNDSEARIIAYLDNAIAYQSANEIYIIPATIKAVISDDNKVKCWFDYPCEMKREDLIEF